jgi:hypothetical protein
MCDNGNEGNMSQIIHDNSQILLISFLRTLILFLARRSYNLITLFPPISPGLSITAFGSFRFPRAYYWLGYHRLVDIPGPRLRLFDYGLVGGAADCWEHCRRDAHELTTVSGKSNVPAQGRL